MALADRFRLLSPHFVEREVGGTSFKYYANSVRVAARMAPMIARLAGHLSTLLGSAERDQGRVIEDFESKGSGERISKTVLDPINPDLAKMRVEKRQAAVQGAIEALLDEGARLNLCEMLVDSLRDEFPRTGDRVQTAKELAEGMDTITFVEHMRGLAAANAKVFGDLGNFVRRAVRQKAGDLLGQPASEQPASQETHG